jgi:hypothetical protein
MRAPAILVGLPGLPRVVRVPFAFAVLLVVLVFALRHYEYSKAWLVSASLEEARAPRDPMALGDLHWDPAPYRHAPSLEPLRAMVAQHCAGRDAVTTADCLTDLFARRFPHGVPTHELFDSTYSPADDLADHLAGAPGHCVTRSGLLAAAMLSAGFPARVVQLIPPTGGGHNIAEVWDAARGWVYIDPTYGLTLDGPPGGHSAATALGPPERDDWRINPTLREVPGVHTEPAILFKSLGWLTSGHLVYPDPWLYTRVGHRAAPAPFQARFVVVGPPSFRLGIAQPLLHVGITLALIGLLGSVIAALAHLSAPPTAPAVDLTRAPGPLQAHPAAVVVRPGRANDVDPPGSAVA